MALDTGSAQVALALAAFFAAPATLIAPEGLLDPGELAVLPGSGLALRLKNRLLAGRLGFDRAAFAPGFRDLLATRATCRLACQLVLSPAARLAEVQRHLAAAVHQTRLKSAVLKSDREALAAVLGEAAWQSGLRQAPVFATALAGLAPSGPAAITDPGAILDHAGGVAVALVSAEDSLLGRILTARLPGAHRLAPLTDSQRSAAWRLIESLP
jgi:hypothetical protein